MPESFFFLCKILDGNQCKKQRYLPCHCCHVTMVSCPFGRAEPVEILLEQQLLERPAAHGSSGVKPMSKLQNLWIWKILIKSWWYCVQTMMNRFTVCSSQCWVSTVWWNLEVPVEHLLFACCAPEAGSCCSFGVSLSPPLLAFFFFLRKKILFIVNPRGFLSSLCEGGLASWAWTLCEGHALLSTFMWC